MGIDARLKLARLYLCTDARQEQGDFAEFVEAAVRGGVDIIQLRQKGLPQQQEIELVQQMRRIVQAHRGLSVVNDSPEIAGTAGADVVHLGQDDTAPARARTHLSSYAKIGRSTHDPDQIRAALDNLEVDYFAVGPVWQTPTKPDAVPVGVELVRTATTLAPPSDPTSKPWFAIGGVDASNLDVLIEAGARRICVVRAICDADDPEEAARVLKDRLRQAWQDDPAMQDYLTRAVR
ncbi:MAG TPA: thiamine phosphate synthase [Candidatus Avipropionibacterium avicola]|uniref:Thiamine-phosphate synthase n=1 Tax=Candidatus Avipropionibacterium avicola TaxID=2840701 RepID=A0A9D1GYM4_9ACTN|nr:thiamine phosphate synthase [Candidatus Avipropionibacterium avicola]